MNNTIWQQWDQQEERRLRRLHENKLFVELNNLYLAIERNKIHLSITNANRLRVLVNELYPTKGLSGFQLMIQNDIRDHWEQEFRKLPDWNNI